MAGPGWEDELGDTGNRVAEAFERATAEGLHRTNGLTFDEIRDAHRQMGRSYSDMEERLHKEALSEAFFQYAADPNNEMSPQERGTRRHELFEQMKALGYNLDNNEFWDEWRDQMGYNG